MLERVHQVINNHFPEFQTLAATAATQVVGYLGLFSVTVPSTLLITGSAALVASYAKRYFAERKGAEVAGTILGALAGLAVDKLLFYPAGKFSPLAFIAINIALLAVKFVNDRANRPAAPVLEEPKAV